jgi:hypothetical protein
MVGCGVVETFEMFCCSSCVGRGTACRSQFLLQMQSLVRTAVVRITTQCAAPFACELLCKHTSLLWLCHRQHAMPGSRLCHLHVSDFMQVTSQATSANCPIVCFILHTLGQNSLCLSAAGVKVESLLAHAAFPDFWRLWTAPVAELAAALCGLVLSAILPAVSRRHIIAVLSEPCS